ncbi:MAG: 3-phosphoshikimate 1-carboxyvinyltransferase [Candidatus Eisenbacteria bacterium]|nr:3-phosphoshikimate 1-carboxyvinyltransferase [Candidatus Eisenbacteria bacterium]
MSGASLESPSGNHPLRGRLRVVSDKSLTHRGLIFGALAEGETRLGTPNRGADCRATARALQTLGAEIDETEQGLVIRGGRGRLRTPASQLDLENSGTGIRLLAGMLAGLPLRATLTGDASLCRRPMRRIIDPLGRFGATINSQNGLAPLEIEGVSESALAARGADERVDLSIASAQVKSAILLAHLGRRAGSLTVAEPSPSRDHTERLLEFLGAGVTRPDARTVRIDFPVTLRARDWQVPGDISAAAFFLVLGTIAPDARLEIEAVGLNPTRTGVLDALLRMGARIAIESDLTSGPEPLGRLVVESAPLRAITIAGEEVPRLLDEIPVLAVAAARAEGLTWFRDVGELRVKESDRIASTCALLRALGAEVIEEETAFAVRGPVRFRAARIDTMADHRIAMSALIARAAGQPSIEIDRLDMIETSDPEFLRTLATIGGGGV